MFSKQPSLARKILDRITTAILIAIGTCALLAICMWFIFPYYQEFSHMQNCLREGHEKDWCRQVWQELKHLD